MATKYMYVDAATGDDANDGSQGSPFETIQEALNNRETASFNYIYIVGDYTISTSLDRDANSFAANTTNVTIFVGLEGCRLTLTAAMWNDNLASYWSIFNITVDSQIAASGYCVQGRDYVTVSYCRFTAENIEAAQQGLYFYRYSSANNNTFAGFDTYTVIGANVDNYISENVLLRCTGRAIYLNSSSSFTDNYVESLSGAEWTIYSVGSQVLYKGNVVVLRHSTGQGFVFASGRHSIKLIDNYVEGGAYGYRLASNKFTMFLNNVAYDNSITNFQSESTVYGVLPEQKIVADRSYLKGYAVEPKLMRPAVLQNVINDEHFRQREQNILEGIS